MIITISQLVIGSVDLLAAFLLMFGLWRMSSPVTSLANASSASSSLDFFMADAAFI